jgi:predicted MPP superfamily phosphohydrolase
VRQVDVSLSRLPAALDGFRIAHLTDLHIGATLDGDWLREVVADVSRLTCDLIVITGDLVDGYVHHLKDHVAPLGGLAAPHGVFFVTGNHEYFYDADDWIAAVEGWGIRVLRNERVSIGDGAHTFDLVGVDDYNAKRMLEGHGQDLARALEGISPNRETVLLAHQPRTIFEAAEKGVGLQLSGHTHGGQIWPITHLVGLQQPYNKGLFEQGNTQIYVSQGTGYWGPPMRLGTENEIAVIRLRAKA